MIKDMVKKTREKRAAKKTTRGRRVLRWALAACLALFVLLCAYCLIDDTTVALTQYSFRSDDLPLAFHGYKIMCVSDYHNAYFYRQVADIVNDQRPDVLLFLGDMSSMYDYPMNNLNLLLAAIDDDIPVYGVMGNHEYFSLDMDNVDDILDVLAQTRIKMLDQPQDVDYGNYVDLHKDGETIRLVGVRDVWIEPSEYSDDAMAIRFMRGYLDKVCDGKQFTVVAAHRADLYPYLKDVNANLLLSGHIHGGLVRLPVVGGVFGPYGTLLPPYDAGAYKEGSMTMIVSRGCDFNLAQPRVFNGPEVIQITLRR